MKMTVTSFCYPPTVTSFKTVIIAVVVVYLCWCLTILLAMFLSSLVLRRITKPCALGKTTFFSVIYRPPNGNVPCFLNFFEQLLAFVTHSKCSLVVGGDLNIDMSEKSHTNTELLLLLTSYNFRNVITHPTRVTSSSSTLLDLFITNYNTDDISSCVIASDISDHLPIFMSCRMNESNKERSHPEKYISYISDETLETFRMTLMREDWHEVLESTNAASAYETFVKLFKQYYTSSFPLRLVTQATKKI